MTSIACGRLCFLCLCALRQPIANSSFLSDPRIDSLASLAFDFMRNYWLATQLLFFIGVARDGGTLG